MLPENIARRIHNGDRDAFKAVYAEFGRGVYAYAWRELHDASAARGVVKQSFLNLQRELMRSEACMDIGARLDELAKNEVLLARILAGEDGAAIFAEREGEPPHESERSAEQPAKEPAERAPRPQKQPEDLPLRRTKAYMAADSGQSDEVFDAESSDSTSRKKKSVAVRVLLILFLLLFVWVLAGILMDLGVLPKINLGYSWFNANVFPLFRD